MKSLYRNLGIATLVAGSFTACQDEPKYYSSDGVPVLEALNDDVRLPGAAKLPAEAPVKPVKVEESCSFSTFGRALLKNVHYDTSVGVASADVDGDGDLDLIFGLNADYGGQYVICENKMPQKGLPR